MNADAFIEKYESMGTTNQYTASFTVLYNHLKMQHKDFHDNKYNVGYADVYLMDRERINSKRKV
jgi:hypothetical protein